MNKETISKFQLATAIGIILFWILFFTVGFENPSYPIYYSKFEHSFPLPDSFLSFILIMAFIKRNKESWKSFTLVGAGAMIFLGLCDFSFNVLNGMYYVGFIDSIMNIGINLWCIGFGSLQLYFIFNIKNDF